MSNAIATIREDIYNTRDSFAAVLSEPGLNFEREAGFAVQAIQASDYMVKVAMGNRQSVVNAVTNIAAIGISLNPAKKQAYLVPRDGKICLDISYIGLMDLAMAAGSIRWAQAELVLVNDSFALQGMDRPPLHSFNPFAKDRGDPVGVYVVVKTADGDYLTETMSVDEVNAIRDRSSAWKAYQSKGKSCPWVTDWGEMAKKTCVKRAYKYWPKTEQLEQAIHHLNTEGNEGLAPEGAPRDDQLASRWIGQVVKAEGTEALKGVWQSGLAAIKQAGDMEAYSQFKAAVEKRGAELKKSESNTYEGETQCES
ncbi:recombinase RecT [Halomonas sp. V046]|uniref:recombinase RecT n=1 Tax=Halomonas sp. V046 TaxID=3459611 RepID=UPI0040443177